MPISSFVLVLDLWGTGLSDLRMRSGGALLATPGYRQAAPGLKRFEDEDDDEHEDDRVAATPRCDLRDLCVSLSPFPEAKRDAYVVRKFFMSGGSGDEKEKVPSNSNDRAEACRA